MVSIRNNNRKKMLGIAIIVLSLVSCFIFYQLLVRQCFLWTCAPSRSFAVTDVLLPIELYPENAVINLMIPTTDLVGVESGIQHIFWEDSGSFYLSNFTITRFGTINKAIDNYNIRTSLRLAEAHFLHQDLTFQGQGADEYIIGCGTSRFGTNYECAMVARYEEFVITFYTYIKEPVSETTFNEMAVFLDSELAELISR